MFNLAIDSDVVALRIDDISPSGYSVDRATFRQKKTGRPVRFELTEATRETVDDYLRATPKKPGDFLFPGRRPGCSMTTRQYARLVTERIGGIGLDRIYSAHTHCEGQRRR
jgi:integrase